MRSAVLTSLTAAFAACVVSVTPAAGEIEPVALPRPPFPAAIAAFQRPGRTLLVIESSRYRAPGLGSLADARAARWAPAVLRGSRLLRAIRQRSTTFLLYGPDGASARFLVGAHSARLLYAFDFGRFADAPGVAPDERQYTTEQLLWAREADGVLYAETAHLTYASASAGLNAYISAIELATGRLLWRSRALVANASTFVVTGGVIVSGYGFTSEPDYLFVLDRRTGHVLDRLPVPSAPEALALHGERLSVRTYDRSLVVRLRSR